MRALLLLLAACTAPATQTADAGEEVAAMSRRNVFLIAGQSNAVGSAQLADLSAPYVDYVDPYPAVLLAQEINCPTDFTLGAAEVSTDWGDLEPRTPGQRFGVEISAGRTLDSRFGNVAIIKTATNGTNLYSHWDPETANSLYEYLETFVDARMAELPAGSRIVGLFWIQGNGDASSNERAGDYAANLGWLIMRLRQTYGAQIKVAIDRMPEDGLTAAAIVRAQQLIVAQRVEGVVHVDSSDLALTGTFHYTGDSLITLGTRMAEAIPASYGAYGMTTYAEIRDEQARLIETLTPTSAAQVKFQRDEGRVDFRQWAQANPSACFRRFSIMGSLRLEGPLVSNTDVETYRTDTILTIAYPKQFAKYGGENIRDLADLVEEDVFQIDDTIGHRGQNNFLSGQNFCIRREDPTTDDGGAVWFVTLTFETEYQRSV